MDFVYFALIYAWVDNRINSFRDHLMGNTMAWASAIGLTLLTVWILVQGFRILTGQSREPMMAMVVNMSRTAVIVVAAMTMAVGGASIQTFFTDKLARGINGLVTGDSVSPASAIDKNLIYTQVAMAAIDGAQGLNGAISADNVKSAGSASLIAALGVAGPPMTAGAMLLMYKVAIALFIGLGPIFILCLIFKATESMFWRWLNYGLGTLFSMAVLSFMISMVLDLTLRVAAALWAANAINDLFNLQGASGLTSQAMQQGGIGLLMTTLLITAPAMAASFFGGTLGQFMTYSGVNPGGGVSQPGPQGQPAGSYAPQPTSTGNTSHQTGGGPNNPSSTPQARVAGVPASPPSDTVKVMQSP
ncbi:MULTISPECIES: type IV secretion system protein [unclassified Variovorax]|uniref:type IV secretion system protein n=1 Tax=unclassified Variovorax TaxID=663243 RepID=UPI0025766A5C|nr:MULTISPECIES: type IV secretion system protein [unclassified Variovorax]MDM0090465.1 type IV secretion system protein [Variovorax sp. J22G40]MDM0147870.1 type IV secretion system protein [Variovorax sp. J2P1-31]